MKRKTVSSAIAVAKSANKRAHNGPKPTKEEASIFWESSITKVLLKAKGRKTR